MINGIEGTFFERHHFCRATAYMQSAQYAIARRPSVCLSVTRVDQPKTVGVSIMKFSSYGTLSLWFLQGKFYLEILTDPPPSGGVKIIKDWVGKTSHCLKLHTEHVFLFSSNNSNLVCKYCYSALCVVCVVMAAGGVYAVRVFSQ